MYVPGMITGVLLASLFWLITIGVMQIRFEDRLWSERMRTVARERSRQAVIEDHRDHRRSAGCVETMDALDETGEVI
jgi:hypothetical protein